MSSFSSPLLDSAGNINTSRISQELTSALDFDVKYKQVDNMKKRAVRTAGSYDEFKQLVAAAHLKKVSRKEVESLSDVRKGWKKSGTLTRENDLLDLRRSRVSQELTADGSGGPKQSARKPRTSMELDRNLRRMSSDFERLSYLRSFETRELSSLLKKAIDMDMLESIWRLHILPDEEKIADTSLPNHARLESLLNILEILVSLPKWDLLLRLVPSSMVNETVSMLQLLPVGLGEDVVQRSESLLAILSHSEQSPGKCSGVEGSIERDACESDEDESSEDEDEDSSS